MIGEPDVLRCWFKNVSVDMKNTFLFGIYVMFEFCTVSSVNADNRERDVFPSSCGQSVRGAQAHESR